VGAGASSPPTGSVVEPPLPLLSARPGCRRRRTPRSTLPWQLPRGDDGGGALTPRAPEFPRRRPAMREGDCIVLGEELHETAGRRWLAGWGKRKGATGRRRRHRGRRGSAAWEGGGGGRWNEERREKRSVSPSMRVRGASAAFCNIICTYCWSSNSISSFFILRTGESLR
jgi:hypothetical protein